MARRPTSSFNTTTTQARSSSGAGRRSGSSGGSRRRGRSSSETWATTNHTEIREWVESRGGKPACVRGTGSGLDAGMLRIDFPGYSGQESLQEITWNRWFQAFDDNELAFLHQDRTADGAESRFNKLVSRSEAGRGGGGQSRNNGGSSGRNRSGGKGRAAGGGGASSTKRRSSASSATGWSPARRSGAADRTTKGSSRRGK